MPATARPSPVVHRTWRAAARAAQLVLLLLLGVAPLLTAPSARAHDTLIEASPGQDAVAEEPPTEVALTFSAQILDLPTTIVVTAADGAVVAEGRPVVDGQAVRLALPPNLPNGDYDVTWSVVSSDGHRTDDSYAFTIAAAGNQTPPTERAGESTPTPTTSSQPSAQVPEATPAPDSGASGQQDRTAWTPSRTTMLLVPAGIMVLAVAAAFAYRRGSGR